jgi:hypothetical protein
MRRPVFKPFTGVFLAGAMIGAASISACEPAATPSSGDAPGSVAPAPESGPEADVRGPEADVRAPEADTREPEADTRAPEADVSASDSAPEPPPEPDTTAPDSVPEPSPEPAWQHPGSAPVNLGPTEDAPLAEPTPPGTRPRRRVDIDMLDRAFRDVLGGLTWTVTTGSNRVDQFPLLAETLGKPNYIDTTLEDLNPTALFAKFLGDGARKACADRVAVDVSALTARATDPATAPPAILFGPLGLDDTPATAAIALDAQLSALLLRFHGRVLRPEAPGFEEWRWLLASSHQLTGRMDTAWQAVCVALLTHPDFYTL